MAQKSNVSQEQLLAACRAGVEILGPDSSVHVPAARLNDLVLLRELLVAIATGQLTLTPAKQAATEKPATTRPKRPPAAKK